MYTAYNAARAFAREHGTQPVPLHLRNAPTRLMKSLGYSQGYRYAHDEADAFAAGENYFPEGMTPPRFYRPTARGVEERIARRLQELAQRNAQARAEADAAAPGFGESDEPPG
ncbi:replication-associated recombination protein A [mine drainage metagenome]|uniref:Replication-associated recombination protein A n=1 Tax=mine drainage metagenome TaxID=410659 RepID=A0A1J5P7C3_9ZZZZ